MGAQPLPSQEHGDISLEHSQPGLTWIKALEEIYPTGDISRDMDEEDRKWCAEEDGNEDVASFLQFVNKVGRDLAHNHFDFTVLLEH